MSIGFPVGMGRTQDIPIQGTTLEDHQEFQVPKTEGFLNLIFGYFGGGKTPLHKPFFYTAYVPEMFGDWRIIPSMVVFQGTIGYLLCSTLGFLGIFTHTYPLYRAYIGISHRGTLVGVHPTIP